MKRAFHKHKNKIKVTKSVKLTIFFPLLLTVIPAFKKSPGKVFKRGFKKQTLLAFWKH